MNSNYATKKPKGLGMGGPMSLRFGSSKSVVYRKLLKNPSADISGRHQALGFIQGMVNFEDGTPCLLAELTDPRYTGSKRIQQVLSYIGSVSDVQQFLVPILRCAINPETSKPLHRSLRDRFLHSIFYVPSLINYLATDRVIVDVSREDATLICEFLIHVSKAFGEARSSDETSKVAQNLRDRGDVFQAQRLCTILLLDEKESAKEKQMAPLAASSTSFQQHFAAACWVTDQRPPGGRHNNDHLNYRDIAIVPTPEELQDKHVPYVPLSSGDNRIFDDPVTNLLDSNFRLLREDTLSTMRDSIKQRRRPWRNARVIDIDFKEGNGSLSFVVQVDPPINPIRDWDRARLLIHGSVFVFLDASSTVVRTGTITIRKSTEKATWLNNSEGPIFGVKFDGQAAFDQSVHEMTINNARNKVKHKPNHAGPGLVTYEMIEASKSFFAYEPILKALQNMDQIPFEEEIVCLKTWQGQLTYLPQRIQFPLDKNFNGYTCHRLTTFIEDVVKNTCLDASQAQAVLHSLNNRIALIQGPPGTGKTFIGGLIAQIIRLNCDAKVLCVCYTNHALDQFLEHMIAYGEKRVVRMGGRSNSESLAKYQLRTLVRAKAKQTEDRRIRQVDAQLHKIRDSINKNIHVLEQPVTWNSPEGGVLRVLNEEYPDILQFVSVPLNETGFHIVGKKNKAIDKDYLWNEWKQGHALPLFILTYKGDYSDEMKRFWSLSMEERRAFVHEVEQAVYEIVRPSIFSDLQTLNDLVDEKRLLQQARDMEILENARIIGVTTSGAARYRELLSDLAPDVVIVEEAGEVLEAHVLTALCTDKNRGKETKHLILIGDHKQLPPKVETYRLSRPSGAGYSLDVSLFERLFMAGLPSATLELQHRMRPSMSRLIRHQTYPSLKDHDSVTQYPQVKGVADNLVFIDHKYPEEGTITDLFDTSGLTTTKSNTCEAQLSVELVRYFLLQGLSPDRLVVLTPYVGQLIKIIDCIKTRLRDVQAYLSEQDLLDVVETINGYEEPQKVQANSSKTTLVRVSTIDNYQGEESDIVVISLVRSNKQGNIGFLKEKQRVNVLLSRARHGMFIIGDTQTLLQNKTGRDTWGPIISLLSDSGQVRKGLPTVCQIHSSDELIELCRPEDFFKLRPNGGCNRPCVYRLPCGHVCPQMCHPIDQEHKIAQQNCCEPCRRIPPQCSRGHMCGKLCKDPCGDCRYNMGPMILACGHESLKVTCHDSRSPEALELYSLTCKATVKFVFSYCKHEQVTTCGNARSMNPKCPARCSVPGVCGHPCMLPCHSNGDSAHDCKKHCERNLFCGHICGRHCHPGGCSGCKNKCKFRCLHSTCPLPCHKPCSSCVELCDWECEHQGSCKMVCGAPCDRLPCNKRCKKKLKCGHQCPSVCGEPCPEEKYCFICAKKEFQDRVVDMILLSTYKDHDIDNDPIIKLPCGHFFAMTTLDNHIEIDLVYKRAESEGSFSRTKPLIDTNITEKSKQCPECREIIHSLNRYGRVLKFSGLRTLERKHIMHVDEALDSVANTKPEKRSIEILKELESTIKRSPMKLVHDASGGMGETCAPPQRPLIRCLQLLGEAYGGKVENAKDIQLGKALEAYECAIDIAVKSKSIRSEASARLAAARLSVRWVEESNVKLKDNANKYIEAILAMDTRVVRELRDEAMKLKDAMSDEARRKEIKMVVSAIGGGYDYGSSASSHWYTCPNGHPYFIGECGGAMQESRCIECGEAIGGTGHRLRGSNSTWTGLRDIMRN